MDNKEKKAYKKAIKDVVELMEKELTKTRNVYKKLWIDDLQLKINQDLIINNHLVC